jgi:hypothetical protein
MEKQQQQQPPPSPQTELSPFCKYFGNAFIKSLKENQMLSSQKIYYLNMLLGCGNSQKK